MSEIARMMTEEEFKEWRQKGYLTSNACLQFYTGKGCPHGISIKNTKNVEPCKTCTTRRSE